MTPETLRLWVTFYFCQPLLSSHFRLDWSNMTGRNCPLTFPKKLKVDDIDYPPLIRPGTVSSDDFHLPILHFGARRRQQQHNKHFIGEIKSKSMLAPWKRWICFHLVTPQSWCYQAFSESHSQLLTLAFITSSKCQWNWMRGEKCYATSIFLFLNSRPGYVRLGQHL